MQHLVEQIAFVRAAVGRIPARLEPDGMDVPDAYAALDATISVLLHGLSNELGGRAAYLLRNRSLGSTANLDAVGKARKIDTQPVRTYYVRMNITLSADEELVRKARKYAEEHDTSLNQLIRDYLEHLVGELPRAAAAEEFEVTARRMAGNSREHAGTPAWQGRDELYRERTDGMSRG
jgi:hypothetical protein